MRLPFSLLILYTVYCIQLLYLCSPWGGGGGGGRGGGEQGGLLRRCHKNRSRSGAHTYPVSYDRGTGSSVIRKAAVATLLQVAKCSSLLATFVGPWLSIILFQVMAVFTPGHLTLLINIKY